MTFYLYVPRGYDPHRSYPLVLMLHGSGESAHARWTAAQNESVILTQEYVAVWGSGYPTAASSVQARWPCFVVVPQLVDPARWVNVPGNMASYALTAQPAQALLTAIDIVQLLGQQTVGIDPTRLYVTGISMGAFGVWDALERWPSLFAAGVPVAGAGDTTLADRMVQMPLWVFHGSSDTNVPVAGSRQMIAALQQAGGQPCYTELAGQPHGIWSAVYGLVGNPANPLYPWLFAQSTTGPLATVSCAT
jgi:predicted peptidase